MASDSDREAAAFFAHLFRATISADNTSEEAHLFNPIIIGLLGGSLAADEGSATFTADRILLVHPFSRRVAVLRGDPDLFAEMLSAGSGRKGPPPASKASIEALRMVEMVDDGEACSVCLDQFGQAVVKEMPCNHRFHGDCIDKWLGLHGTCPVCRYCMPSEEESSAKKVGSDGAGEGERAVWFEITFGRGVSGDRDQEQDHQGEQIVDGNSD